MTPIDAAFAVDFVGRMKAAMESRDVDAIADLATDDVIYDDMGAARAIESKSEFIRLFRPMFASLVELKLSLGAAFIGVDGESVAAHWKVTGWRRDQDTPLDYEYMAIYTMRDGKVCRWTSIFRHMDWLGQIWP